MDTLNEDHKVVVVRGNNTNVVVMDNSSMSALASLLGNLEVIIKETEGTDLYLLAPNHKVDLFNLRKEVYGY